MLRVGVSIDQIAAWLGKRHQKGKDPSQDLAVHLALAYEAYTRLKEEGADLEFQGRPLILPSLERAWRELLYVRSRLPADRLDVSILTRFGRPNESVVSDSTE